MQIGDELDRSSAGQPATNGAGLSGRIEDAVDQRLGQAVEAAARHVPDTVKPKLRGWLHAGAVPFALAAGIVLVSLSRGVDEVVATSIYATTTVLLFAVSGTYHRGDWGTRAQGVLKRLDHATIFLIIAGSYTPFAVLLLEGGQRAALLGIVWGGALLGVGFRVLWVDAPKWLYVPAYVALGWVAVAFLPAITQSGGIAVLVLVAVGGLLYTVGGIVYGTRRPDPYPTWFGFHEVFHTLTLLAYVCQYVAVSLVVYSH